MRSRLFLALLAGMSLMPLAGCGLLKNAVVLVDDSAVACSNSPVTIDVLANDIIGSKVAISAVTVSTAPDATLGAAVVNSDNTITFTPVTDAVGAATFQYQVCYSHSSKWHSSSSETCKTAAVTVDVRGAATVVTATDDTATAQSGKSVRIDVLSNDSISDGGKPTITSVTTPSAGTATIVSTHAGQQIRYTPDESATGEATFQYTISDGCVGTATAQVTVTVEAAAATNPLASFFQRLFSSSSCQAPAKVLLVNSSNFEITVFVGGKQVDVVQPLGSTVVPAKVAAGNDQEVRVEALLPEPDPARVTSTSFSFAAKGRYTITYADDNVLPASITVEETP